MNINVDLGTYNINSLHHDIRTGTYRGLLSAIWVLVAQWLERLTGDQKVAGPIPVWGSETFFWVCDKAWVANNFHHDAVSQRSGQGKYQT